jgi:hypothetical protein
LDEELGTSLCPPGWLFRTGCQQVFAWGYEKYAQQLDAQCVFFYMKSRIILTDQSEDEVQRCKPFFPESQASDVVHAATCLHTAAVLITNDKHFDKIRDADLIRVWSISEAIKNLL